MGLGLNRFRTFRSDPFGRVPTESFWNSFRRDWQSRNFGQFQLSSLVTPRRVPVPPVKSALSPSPMPRNVLMLDYKT
jgi:hypothetical protein